MATKKLHEDRQTKRRKVRNSKDSAWKKQSEKWRSTHGGQDDTTPSWTTTAQLRGVNRKERVLDLINCVHRVNTKKSPDNLEDLALDCPETHDRFFKNSCSATRPQKTITAITRNVDHYVFSKDRVVLPEEYGAMLGYQAEPIKELFLKATSGSDQSPLRDLLANTMALPHIGLVLASGIMALEDIFVA